jgi:hypothetical protein
MAEFHSCSGRNEVLGCVPIGYVGTMYWKWLAGLQILITALCWKSSVAGLYIMVAEQNTSWGWVNLHYHWERDSISDSSVQLVIIMVIAKSDPNINDRAKHVQLFSIYCKENWFSLERGTISCCFFPISSVLQMCLKFWETESICGCRLDCRWFLNSLRDFI